MQVSAAVASVAVAVVTTVAVASVASAVVATVAPVVTQSKPTVYPNEKADP